MGEITERRAYTSLFGPQPTRKNQRRAWLYAAPNFGYSGRDSKQLGSPDVEGRTFTAVVGTVDVAAVHMFLLKPSLMHVCNEPDTTLQVLVLAGATWRVQYVLRDGCDFSQQV